MPRVAPVKNIFNKPAPVIAPDALVLEARNLVKQYGKRTVVRGVSYHVKQGEVVGILGPNGAGKTTSFYMTIGLVTPVRVARSFSGAKT
jgi:ABC-type lipopolysaccharide export system ATPase subunit